MQRFLCLIPCPLPSVKEDQLRKISMGTQGFYPHWRMWRTTLQGLDKPPVMSQLVGAEMGILSEDQTGCSASEMIPSRERYWSRLRSRSIHLSVPMPQSLCVSPREEERGDGSVLNFTEFKPEIPKENHDHESNRIYLNLIRLHFLRFAEQSLRQKSIPLHSHFSYSP